MTKKINISYLVIAIIFLWIGFVCAISFMEAGLKFQAPGVDLKTGLEIGKLVFKALNKVEWVLCIVLILSLRGSKVNIIELKYTMLLIPIIILAIQTTWLLPQLQLRADLVIQNLPITTANYHLYFIVAEVLKVSALFIISFFHFK